MQLWVAVRNCRDVGRIAGIVDQNHNQTYQHCDAFFGFFECENDAETSRQLFATVFNWARQRGAKRVLGPMNPTTNDECGLLIDGFDSPPQLMMTYNPRYYESLVAAEGFSKAKDLLAFHLAVAGSPRERLERIAAKTRQRNPQFQFRAVTRKSLGDDLVKIKEVYNAAWQENWGFVPMTDAEIEFLAARLEPLLVDGRGWLAGELETVRSEQLGEVAAEFAHVHTVQRAVQVGSLDSIVPPSRLRPYLVDAIERGLARAAAGRPS